MRPLRLRLRFTKTGRVRFIGHLDLVRVWERAVRRAALPLEFTAGFSPRPRMHFGLALPTGFASTAEYLDVDLVDDLDAETATSRLNAVLPEGIAVVGCARVDAGVASLQSAVTASDYLVVTEASRTVVEEGSHGVIAAGVLPYQHERKGRLQTVDLRPGVLQLDLVGDAEAAATELGPEGTSSAAGCRLVRMRLAAQPRSYRPTEICSVMEPSIVPKLVHRSAQLVGGPAHYTEPLDAGPPADESALRSEPVEERSGHGPLREKATSESPTASRAPADFTGGGIGTGHGDDR